MSEGVRTVEVWVRTAAESTFTVLLPETFLCELVPLRVHGGDNVLFGECSPLLDLLFPFIEEGVVQRAHSLCGVGWHKAYGLQLLAPTNMERLHHLVDVVDTGTVDDQGDRVQVLATYVTSQHSLDVVQQHLRANAILAPLLPIRR